MADSFELQTPETPKTAEILLVDDREDDYLLLKYHAERAGLQTRLTWMQTARDAINYLRTAVGPRDDSAHAVPCLVLVDLDLPADSGFDVLKWIRQQPELNSLIVWVYTGSLEATDATHAYQLDANSYVVKPKATAEWKTFVKSIETCLQWLTQSEDAKAPNPC